VRVEKWKNAQNSFWGGQEAREKDAQIKIAFYAQLVSELQANTTIGEDEKNSRIRELEDQQTEAKKKLETEKKRTNYNWKIYHHTVSQ
jgi:hypothetical protein